MIWPAFSKLSPPERAVNPLTADSELLSKRLARDREPDCPGCWQARPTQAKLRIAEDSGKQIAQHLEGRLKDGAGLPFQPEVFFRPIGFALVPFAPKAL